MNLKKMLSLMMALVMVVGLGAISLADDFPVPNKLSDKPVIAVMTHSLTAESTQRDIQQLQNECDHRGWTLRVEAAGGEMGPQLSTMETLINAGVDAIILIYVHVDALGDAIAQAREKGIGVYCLDTEAVPGVIVNATMPNGVAGATIAYYGINRLGRVGNVVVLNCKWHIARRRALAAEAIISDFPNMEILATEYITQASYTQDSYDYMQNWLTRFGDDIDWVFGDWDALGMGAARAIMERGYTVDDMFVTGCDGGSAAFQEILDPENPFVASYVQPFEAFAHELCEVINQVQNEGIAPGAPGSMVPASKVIYVPGTMVDETTCPPAGSNINVLFDYYDPNAGPEAWYNWGTPYTTQ